MHLMAAFDLVLAAMPAVCIIVNSTLNFVSGDPEREFLGNNLRRLAIREPGSEQSADGSANHTSLRGVAPLDLAHIEHRAQVSLRCDAALKLINQEPCPHRFLTSVAWNGSNFEQ
jgi:hypothetical protein